MKNKQEILIRLKRLLNATTAGEDIEDLHMDPKQENVSISFKKGGIRKVNIACDSGIAGEGWLLWLPCVPGTTVYEVYLDNSYTDYWWDIMEIEFSLSYYEKHSGDFGKTVFTDKQRAAAERDKRNGKM